MNYDAIVIGAGNGGLVTALTLQKKGQKVLLLEKNNVPGGVATSFKRGRFEFEASLHELCQYGKNADGDLAKLFKELGVIDKLQMVAIPETFHVITLDTNEEYTFPVGVEAFIAQMEEYVPNSKKSMENFFELCEEVKEALAYLNSTNGQPDKKVLKTKYPNFMICASYSLNTVLKSLKMPKKARQILSTYWTYLGSPSSKISFVHYASMLYSYVKDQPVIPINKSHEISLTLYEEFLKLGGVGKFLTEVSKIIVENNQVEGVETTKKEIYYAKTIICDISPNLVYSKLIDSTLVPKKARQLTNSRQLGARGVCIYLGLNKSPEELGLTNYSYFIYHTLDSNKEFKRMHQLKSDNLVGVVLNNAYKDASPQKTTILYLTSLIFSSTFSKIVNKENYFLLKEAYAENLIDVFETATGCQIKDAIEEIEVATPVTFARYTNQPDGVIYGYLATECDNLLPRLMNMDKENYIDGLFFAGGFGPRLSGYSSSYLSGNMVALKAMQRKAKETN